jgi:hypothetical protein
MNSLGVEPFVNNLYQDLRDGIALLWLFNKVHSLQPFDFFLVGFSAILGTISSNDVDAFAMITLQQGTLTTAVCLPHGIFCTVGHNIVQ